MENVDPKLAEACIQAFSRDLKVAGDARATTAIGFDSKKLLQWLEKVAPRAKEIQIKFGKYQNEYSFRKEDNGRTTVFLCASNEDGSPAEDEEGNEIPPVNAGNPYP